MPDLKIFTTNAYGALVPGIPRPPETVEGIDLLVQIVALLYLNNGGRSIFKPGRAGGLRDYIGLAIDPEDPSELFADLRLMTSRIEQIIKEEQVQTRRPPSERLLSLQLIDIAPGDDDRPDSVELIVAVINEEHSQEQAVVVV
jgi:hypothetical protein